MVLVCLGHVLRSTGPLQREHTNSPTHSNSEVRLANSKFFGDFSDHSEPATLQCLTCQVKKMPSFELLLSPAKLWARARHQENAFHGWGPGLSSSSDDICTQNHFSKGLAQEFDFA